MPTARCTFDMTKSTRLVHLLEQRALEYLVRRDGLHNRCTVEVKALDLGGRQELLRIVPEEEYGGTRGLAVGQEVEARQRVLRAGLRAECKLPLDASPLDEPGNALPLMLRSAAP